jgi:hypothetical protein
VNEEDYNLTANTPNDASTAHDTGLDHPVDTSPSVEPAANANEDWEEFLAQQSDDTNLQSDSPENTPENSPTKSPTDSLMPPTEAETHAASPAADESTQAAINLPMGAWLGFHDGDTPLMARLAVYDLEDDYYIFVNRQGVKMRQVNRLTLLKLIDDGLVDILETKSSFRDEVIEVRKKLEPK